MSDGAKYETDEARQILVDARARMHPASVEEEQARAAHELLATVVRVVEDAGYSVKPDKDGGLPTVTVASRLHGVWLRAHLGGIQLGTILHGATTRHQDAAIAYDAGRGVWVGVADETGRVPTPGEPVRRKRSAAVVVADAIVAALMPESP